MDFKNLTRRQFLSGAACASLLPLLKGSKSFGAGNVAPLRLILVRSPFQYSEPFFHPWTSSSNPTLAPQGSNFYLQFPNSSLAPLAPYQSDLLIFRGLKHATPGGSHATSFTTFSGATVIPDPNQGGNDRSNGTSIDHHLFKRMAHAGSLSPAIVGALTGVYTVTGHSINAGAASVQTTNPRTAWNTYFKNFNPGGTTASPQLARRQFALNLTQARLQGMMSRLPASASSYSVLQSHLASVQGLKQQLAGGGASLASCQKPLESSIADDPNPYLRGNYNGSNAAADYASFNTLVSQMFACDLTRFVSYDMGSGEIYSGGSLASDQVIYQEMPDLRVYPDFHANVSHGTTANVNNPLDVAMARWKAYYFTKVANLLALLKSVADPYAPTQSIYDNTIVLIGSEGPCQVPGSDVHNEGPNKSDFAYIVAGGCGGYFKRGQLIMAGGSKAPGVNHNALLTNIVNTFEKNQQQFNPAFVPSYINQHGDYSIAVSPTSWLS